MMRVEKRGGRLYVYEAHREGHRVVRSYVGTAANLGALAEFDGAERAENQARRREEHRLLEASQEQDSQDSAHLAQLDRLIGKGLAALGLHRPKRGQLRRKRHD